MLPLSQLGRTSLMVSQLSCGCSPFGVGQMSDTIDVDELIRLVREAVQRGVKLFDVSPYYGRDFSAEINLGKALRALPESVPRDSYYVMSKLGRYGVDTFDFSADNVRKSILASIERLGCQYLDVCLLHDVEFVNLDDVIRETIPALQKCKEEGLVKHIGFSCLPFKAFHYVLDRVPVNTVDVVISYCHFCLLDDSLLGELDYFASKGVAVVNAATLSMGLLTNQGPPHWHPASSTMKDKCKEAAEYAAKENVNISALALKYVMQNKRIATHLTGMAKVEELERNLKAITEPLTEEEARVLEQVKQILAPTHNETWLQGRKENN